MIHHSIPSAMMTSVTRFSFAITAVSMASTAFLPIAFAASSSSAMQMTPMDSLYEDLNVWQGVMGDDVTEQTMQENDMSFQLQKELFPDISKLAAEPMSVLDEVRKERTDDFVTITINGASVTLADVPRDEWYAPYIRSIADRGLVSGYRDAAGNPTGRFGPADNVTIEQMAKVAVSAIGVSTADCVKPTVNVTASGSWSAPYFSCAEQQEWTVYGDGSVDAHRNATRAEVVATLLQAYKKFPDTGTGASFTDVSSTMQYGSIIAQAKMDGVISGYTDANGEPTGLFGPNDPVTRAEFAKIVTMALQVYGSTGAME